VLSDRDRFARPAVNAGHCCSSTARRQRQDGHRATSAPARRRRRRPHAIAVEGQIIRIFDPVARPIVTPEASRSSKPVQSRIGAGVLPAALVTVGGDTADALELTYLPSPGSIARRCRRWPTAASGHRDFGGSGRPRDLLNRWIVPLESRVDYLTLQTGRSSSCRSSRWSRSPPTSARAISSTKRSCPHPLQGVRRSPSAGDYAIWATPAPSAIAFDGLVERLLAECYRPRRLPLRAVIRDSSSRRCRSPSRGETTRLTFTFLAAACDSYSSMTLS
jgi:hypothetical protein